MFLILNFLQKIKNIFENFNFRIIIFKNIFENKNYFFIINHKVIYFLN